MVRYVIFDKKCVQKKGLNKCFIRSTSKKKYANTFVSGNPNAYIVKKLTNKQFKDMNKKGK